jgi:putative DNA-invertase from lambdoid prophage Rac
LCKKHSFTEQILCIIGNRGFLRVLLFNKGVSEMIWGYARVSTSGQDTSAQVFDLVSAGVPHERIIEEKVSGGVRASARPGLSALLDRLVSGDVLTVTKLDRLGRDVIDTLGLIRDLKARGVGVRVLALGADTSGSAGSLIINVLASVADWERQIISERTKEGLAQARREGRVGGRRHKLNIHARDDLIEAVKRGESVASIAKRNRVSRGTVYNVIRSAA